MNTNRLPLFYILFFLAFIQSVMLVAVGIVPVAQSAASSAVQSPPRLDLSATLTDLAAKSELVVQAQVMESRSQWNQSHTLIETAHTLTVRQSLLGPTAVEIIVYTEGGFLPNEGLGMFSSHTPRFAIGEEVLVFLQQENQRYQVTDGEAGKFTIFQKDAASAYYREHLPLAQITTILSTTNSMNHQVRQPIVSSEPVRLPATTDAQSDRAAPLTTATPTPSPAPKWLGATPKIMLQVNLNSTQIGGQAGSAEQFLTAIKNALRTWSVIPEAGVTLLYDGATTSLTTGFNRKSEIIFMKKGANSQLGQAQIWFTSSFAIIEADLWVNDDYVLDATGNPTGGRN